MARTWILALGCVLVISGMSGCASTQPQTASNPDDDLSTLPWNRPQRWEGAGMMGGFLPQQ
jgi:hypothetical protein